MGAISLSKKINLITTVIIFLWISWLPTPLQVKAYLWIKMLMILAFIWMIASRTKELRSIFAWGDLPVLIFIICLGPSIFFAQFRTVAFGSYLDLAIPLFFIFYLVKEGVSSEGGFVFLAKAVSLISIFVALLAIFECWFATNPIYEYYVNNPFYQRYITGFVRPMSTQMHTVVLGTYLLGCLPFNFILFKQGRNFFKILGIAGIILNVTVIILTFSRGVFFGLTAMALVYLILQGNYRKAFIFLGGILLFILLCSYLPYPFSRFSAEGILFVDGGSLSAYLSERWIMVKNMVHQHPWSGIGLQHFRIRFDDYYQGIVKVPFEADYPGAMSVPLEFKVADNMYQTLLAETGVIGFLGFSVMAVYFLVAGYQQVRRLHYAWEKRTRLAAVLAVFAGFLVNLAAYDLFYWPGQYIYFCIIIGILAGYFKSGHQEPNL